MAFATENASAVNEAPHHSKNTAPPQSQPNILQIFANSGERTINPESEERMVQEELMSFPESSKAIVPPLILDHQRSNNISGHSGSSTRRTEYYHDIASLNLASGFMFLPAEHELIYHYLLKKIIGLKMPCNLIGEVGLYKQDPYQLPIDEFKYGRPNEAYFFTRTTGGASSSRMQTTKSGFWKAVCKDQTIIRKRLILGFKKTMVFFLGNSPESDNKTSWIIREYRVNPGLIPSAQINDSFKTKIENYVVCWIRCKDEDRGMQQV